MKNNQYMFLLVLLVGVAGCGKQKQKQQPRDEKEVMSNVDIPVAQDGIRSLFDDELGEYALADDKNEVAQVKPSDYSWEEEKNQKFKVVYFDFDHYNIREDQKEVAVYNVEQIKQSLEEAQQKGANPLVIIEGHACHSAGSATYNLALSEKRAKVLRDYLVEQGISADAIKIVGRGQEVPAIVAGKPCEGDRAQQAPNRRDEIRVMFS